MTNNEELAIETLKRRKACMETSSTIEPHYLSDLPDEIIKSLQTVAIDVSDGFVVFERKRPQGEWILPNFYGDGVSYECNKCHIPHEGYIGKDDKPHGYDFCPNCGADMRGNKE